MISVLSGRRNNFITLLIGLALLLQVARSQSRHNSEGYPPGESISGSKSIVRDADYLFGYKTLYLSVGSTLYGRFLNLGFMANRYSVEVEGAVQLRKIRIIRDPIRTNSNSSLRNALNLGEPDSNISLNIATVRTFRRDKIKFLGALLELDAGLNLKTWFYKNNKVTIDSLYTESPANTAAGNQLHQFAYVYDAKMEFSSGPSLKFRVSSGKEKGEAVFNVIGDIDVNYFFSRKEPSLDIGIGIMFAPFSY